MTKAKATKLDKEIQEGLYDPKSSQKAWDKIAVHKELVGVRITESVNRTNDKVRRFTATIRGWRNWKLFEGEIKPNTFKQVIELAKMIRERIDSSDESVFKESKLYDPKVNPNWAKRWLGFQAWIKQHPADYSSAHEMAIWRAITTSKSLMEAAKKLRTLKAGRLSGSIKTIQDAITMLQNMMYMEEAHYDPKHKTLFNRVVEIFKTGKEFSKESRAELYRIKEKIGKSKYTDATRQGLDLRYPSTKKGKEPEMMLVHYDPKPPSRWYEAMVKGITRSSDVRNPYAIVKNIWSKLSPSKRAEIKRREAKGERFKYNLPLPVDKPTRGIGTVRMVKPFKLAEVQVNLSVNDYLSALKSGIFSRMKRQDGTTALVARCKSPEKNVNIFVDKAGK